jgi:hypothetical protein
MNIFAQEDEACFGGDQGWKYQYGWLAWKWTPAFPQDALDSDFSTFWSQTCLL